MLLSFLFWCSSTFKTGVFYIQTLEGTPRYSRIHNVVYSSLQVPRCWVQDHSATHFSFCFHVLTASFQHWPQHNQTSSTIARCARRVW